MRFKSWLSESQLMLASFPSVVFSCSVLSTLCVYPPPRCRTHFGTVPELLVLVVPSKSGIFMTAPCFPSLSQPREGDGYSLLLWQWGECSNWPSHRLGSAWGEWAGQGAAWVPDCACWIPRLGARHWVGNTKWGGRWNVWIEAIEIMTHNVVVEVLV